MNILNIEEEGETPMHYIGKILPIDGYKVVFHGPLPIDYAVSLTHLYQPLIGMDGIMLYQTLLHEEHVQPPGELQTHHTLMNYVQQPLDILYEARLKLEGIGLLRTYKELLDGRTCFTYVLQSPFSPTQFLRDAMLSELLYHHIGKTKFNDLKHILSVDHSHAGEEVTSSFEDVFQTFQPTYVADELPEQQQQKSFINTHPSIDEQSFRHALSRKMIPPERVLTKQNKDLIAQMMDVYQLETVEITRCLTWSVTEEHLLNEAEFKDACEELFKTKNRTTKIKLTPKQRMTQTSQHEEQAIAKQDEADQTEVEQPQQTRREILLREFESMSLAQLLADHSPNGNVSKRDLDVVQEVMQSQGLARPVMNVLIHYVFMQQNKQLAKKYLETIASHWARVGFTTADEAMRFAQSVNERFNQAKEKARKTKQKTQKEIIPDWYDEHMKQIEEVERTKEEKRKQQEKSTNEQDVEKELQELIRSVAKK